MIHQQAMTRHVPCSCFNASAEHYAARARRSRAYLLTVNYDAGPAMTAGGLGFCLAAAAALGRVISGLLYEVRPTDGTVFAAIALCVAVGAFLGCCLPANRASLIDPVVTPGQPSRSGPTPWANLRRPPSSGEDGTCSASRTGREGVGIRDRRGCFAEGVAYSPGRPRHQSVASGATTQLGSSRAAASARAFARA